MRSGRSVLVIRDICRVSLDTSFEVWFRITWIVFRRCPAHLNGIVVVSNSHAYYLPPSNVIITLCV